MDVWLKETKARRRETTACQEATEACLEKVKAGLEELEATVGTDLEEMKAKIF
jgi:hypothetical protein